MRGLELGKAVDYSLNILSKTSGWRGVQDAIDWLKEKGEKDKMPFIMDGGIGWMSMFLFPATMRLLRNPVPDSEFGKYLGPTKVIVSMMGDFGSDLGAAALILVGKPAEGIGMKMIYNALVATAPDITELARDTFRHFRSKPPTAIIA